MVGRPTAVAAGGGGGLILGDRQAQGACWDFPFWLVSRLPYVLCLIRSFFFFLLLLSLERKRVHTRPHHAKTRRMTFCHARIRDPQMTGVGEIWESFLKDLPLKNSSYCNSLIVKLHYFFPSSEKTSSRCRETSLFCFKNETSLNFTKLH
jgi:hypothetical protein